MYDPILVTLLKMRPHYSQSSWENATPSSGTSPLASYKEVPPTPPSGCSLDIRKPCYERKTISCRLTLMPSETVSKNCHCQKLTLLTCLKVLSQYDSELYWISRTPLKSHSHSSSSCTRVLQWNKEDSWEGVGGKADCLQSPVMEEGITLTVKHSNKKGMKGHKHWPVNTRGEFWFLLSKKKKEKTFVLYYHVGLPATLPMGLFLAPSNSKMFGEYIFILNKLKT